MVGFYGLRYGNESAFPFGIPSPEFGISEAIAPRVGTGATNSISRNIAGVPASSPAPRTPSQPTANYSPVGNTFANMGGDVLGTSTTGGGGGGQGAPSGQGAPMEEAPGAPDFSIYDDAYNQGVAALDQAQQAAQQATQTGLGEITAGGKQRTAQAQAAQKEKLGALGEQRVSETQRGENAISEARRQAAELQQGLQARYGRTTGTGAFTGELLGRQAMQNIGQNRQMMQQTLGQIGAAETRVREETSRLLDQIESDTQFARERARNQLAQILADIAGKKGELQQAKADRRMQALQSYQNLVADINARNTAYKQELYNKAQKTAQALNSFRDEAVQKFQFEATPFEGLTISGSVPSNQIGQLQSQLRGVTDSTGLPNEEDQLPQVTQGAAASALGL